MDESDSDTSDKGKPNEWCMYKALLYATLIVLRKMNKNDW